MLVHEISGFEMDWNRVKNMIQSILKNLVPKSVLHLIKRLGEGGF